MSATFEGQLREKSGSRGARKLRAEGQIPCNIQGGDGQHVNFSIGNREFFTARRQHEHLFDINLGSETETALVRELQWDALGEDLLHIEFRRVVRGQETEAEVTLNFIGINSAGFVQHLLERLTVAAIPSLIPEHLEVLVASIELGTPLTAGDLELPEGVRLVTPADAPVASVAETKEEIEEEEEVEEEEGLTAAPPEEE